MTTGGYIGQNDFGLSYVKALVTIFFGISDVISYTVEWLDIVGADAESIINQAKASIIGDV